MKLNNKRTILVGLAFMSILLFWQVYEGIVPLILKETFNVGDTFSGVIMALDNILALIMLPLFGTLSDKTDTRIGRRMPYIIIGTIAASIFMILIPIGDRIRSLPLFFTALLLVLVSMSIYRSPAVALMPDVTPKPLRAKGNAIINLMGTFGGLIGLILTAVLVPAGEHPNYIPLFVAVAALMLTAVAVLYRKVNEKQLVETCRKESEAMGIDEAEPDTKNSTGGKLSRSELRSLLFLLASVFLWYFGYNAVTSAFSKYARVYWGLEGGLFAYTLMVALVAATIAYIPAGMLAAKIGSKKTILIGVALLTVSFGCGILFRTFSLWVFLLFSFAGFGWAMINVNSYPMVVEISRAGNIGKYTGYYYTFSMCSQIITPILSGACLEHIGYWSLFPYAALFAGLSFVTMCFVRHGDIKPVQKSKLEVFDND